MCENEVRETQTEHVAQKRLRNRLCMGKKVKLFADGLAYSAKGFLNCRKNTKGRRFEKPGLTERAGVMETSLERIRQQIEQLAQFNETPGNGCTRFSYSEEDRKARQYLKGCMEELGLTVSTDAIGNMKGRLEGNNPDLAPIMCGSHIDTVRHGGNYDGIAGVVGAIETARVLKEHGITLEHPYEVMIFAEEEGSNFNAPTTGSKALAGHLSMADLKRLKNDQGVTYYDVLKNAGYNPEGVEDLKVQPGDIRAMLEMHIEQSVLLERKNLSVGVVRGIAGIRAYVMEIEGMSNHAGATPMDLRNDPMVAAGRIITALPELVRNHGGPATVGTVGRIECVPNQFNVIPQKVRFTLDIRDVDNDAMDRVLEAVRTYGQEVANQDNVSVTLEKMIESRGNMISKEIADVFEDVVRERNIPYTNMNSGAVHDAAIMTEVTEVGMVFVPSINGRSHVPEEYTPYENIKEGCDVLLDAVLRIDQM